MLISDWAGDELKEIKPAPEPEESKDEPVASAEAQEKPSTSAEGQVEDANKEEQTGDDVTREKVTPLQRVRDHIINGELTVSRMHTRYSVM